MKDVWEEKSKKKKTILMHSLKKRSSTPQKSGANLVLRYFPEKTSFFKKIFGESLQVTLSNRHSIFEKKVALEHFWLIPTPSPTKFLGK